LDDTEALRERIEFLERAVAERDRVLELLNGIRLNVPELTVIDGGGESREPNCSMPLSSPVLREGPPRSDDARTRTASRRDTVARHARRPR